ncbi:MAG TPA: hypothetical protein PKD53_09205 [Chloroflexaceae bacterium]|nr:hypothetical protein [Chloroflexaceae bacterium]
MGRRVVSLSLPASDPHSTAIIAWLDTQPAGSDIAPALRRLIAEALDTGPRLAAIEAKLDRVLTGGVVVAPPANPLVASPADPLVAAAIDELLDFGV